MSHVVSDLQVLTLLTGDCVEIVLQNGSRRPLRCGEGVHRQQR